MSDGAGYACAFIGALTQGSYGVPIKATKDVDVHPLILQSYKTLVFAFMSCVVVPFVTIWLEHGKEYDANNNSTLRFTPFGVLSGFLWVSGGSCGVYGIRNAGMAVAVGTYASLHVCVNFTWGILIFEEPVHSFWESCVAFGLLLVGLVGMSKYSDKTPSDAKETFKIKKTRPEDIMGSGEDESSHHHDDGSPEVEDDSGNPRILSSSSADWGDVEMKNSSVGRSGSSSSNIGTSTRRLANRGPNTANNNKYANGSSSNMMLEEEDTSLTKSLLKKLSVVVYGDELMDDEYQNDHDRHQKKRYANLNPIAIWYRFVALVTSLFASLTPRQAGICMAVMNGLFGGCSLVPLHYAKKQGFQGLTYIPSFGLGSFVANIALWSLYFCWTYQQQRRHYHSQPEQEIAATTTTSIWKSSVELMPSFHWSVLWKRGLLAGFLLSIGMIFSILATGALGQGVGNSLVQLKILISGLWGIFYYKEIQNKRSIKLWFLSACICVSGILGLSYQRLMAAHDAAVAAALPVGMSEVAASSVAPTKGMITAPLNSPALLDTTYADLPKLQVAEDAGASVLGVGGN